MLNMHLHRIERLSVDIGQEVSEISTFVRFSRPPSWIFKILKFHWLTVSRRPRDIAVPNFVKSVNPLRKGLLWFFNFSKWRPSAILNLFRAHLDHQRRTLCYLYRCAKFDCNRCSSFENMKVWFFCTFGLKTLIRVPKIVFLEFDFPKWAAISTKPQKAHPCASPRRLSHKARKSADRSNM